MTCAFKYDNMYSYEQQRRKKKKMNARRMTSPTIVNEMMSGNIPTERDALVLLDIRTGISKALSKMKKCSVEVFDECIAFGHYEKNDEPKDFQIQIRHTDTTSPASWTGQLTYTVQGKFNSIT